MFCFYGIFPRFQRHRIGVLNHIFGDRCGDDKKAAGKVLRLSMNQKSGLDRCLKWFILKPKNSFSKVYAFWQIFCPDKSFALINLFVDKMRGSICHRSRDVSRGRGGECAWRKAIFFRQAFATCSPCWPFISDLSVLFRPLSVRDTFIYAKSTLFSNYGINKALPPKADKKAE